jgi:undecaprenyl-diphosphatase
VVRAFIPLLAGIAGMSPGRFDAANVASVVAWAPLHVLPGAAVEASLGALGGMSGRVLALLGLVALAGRLLIWLVRIVWQQGYVLLGQVQDKLLVFLAGRDGRLAGLARDLIDPEKPAVRSVVLLGGILAAAVLAFVNLIEDVLARGELTRADAVVSNLVTGLRTAWATSDNTNCANSIAPRLMRQGSTFRERRSHCSATSSVLRSRFDQLRRHLMSQYPPATCDGRYWSTPA